MTDVNGIFENRYLVLNDQGVVQNIIIGYVNIPIFGMIQQSDETSRVGVGWQYNATTDTFDEPEGGLVQPPVLDYLISGSGTEQPSEM